MLNLRPFYRLNSSDHQIECYSQKQNYQQSLTVGICDYIHQQYFNRQYFSIYIEGISFSQIIQSILWNQYYQKTLLKQIYAQLTTYKRKNEDSLIAKLDNMISKNSNNSQLIYLKIGSNVYNLKDKLEYNTVNQLQKQIKQTQSLTIQKITQQGKWKKISISFAPYQNKEQYDIIFSLNLPKQIKHSTQVNFPRQVYSEMKNYSDSINQTQLPKTTTQIKTKKHPVRKNSTQSQRKSYKNIQSSTNKKQQPQKDTSISIISSKQKSKSKIQKSVPSSHKKSSTAIDKFANSQNKIIENSHDLSQNQIISNSLQKSFKNKNQVFQHNPLEIEVLKEINFNNTAKLSSSHNFGYVIQQEPNQPVSMDLRRKQTLKVKQNSIMNDQKVFTTDSETIKNYKDQAKNNSVLAQILSKKQQTIQSQKRRMQQLQQRHAKEIQELKLKHLKETQSFKDEISQILSEYNKKYENQKEDSKKLRYELGSLQQVLSQNKVIIAELQITSKFNQEQATRFKQQGSCLKNKLSELQEKYNKLMLISQEQKTKIINERDKAQSLADKYIKKYNNLAKKLRILAQQQQQEQN